MLMIVDLSCKKDRAFYQRMVEDAWLSNLAEKRSKDEEYLTFLSKCNSNFVEALRMYEEDTNETREVKPESFRVPPTGRADS